MNPRPAAEVEAVAAENPPASGECVATPEAAQGRPDAVGVTATLAELRSAFAYASGQGAAVGPDATAGAGAPVSPHQ